MDVSEQDRVWNRFASDVKAARSIDNLVTAKTNAISFDEFKERTNLVISELNESYLEYLANQSIEDLSDERLSAFARYTDGTPLRDYENALDLVPELVNLVSLADALPLDGSSLPFDLKKIAVRCRGAVYFAPRRFTAVQLPFDEPRSRVLLFHTGRVVGTGSDSAMAAKLAVARALKTIQVDAGVHVVVRRFAVINQVGAISLGARLDCDAFADTHSATAHYDAKSFVGLAWRPFGESICSEIYSTGKSNLPGSRRERQLLRSFARMAPELLRHSTNPALAERFSDRLRAAHRPSEHARVAPRASLAMAAPKTVAESLNALWDEPIGRGTKRAAEAIIANEDEEEAFGELFDGF